MIWAKAQIIGAEHISLGDRVIIDDFVLLMATQPMLIGRFVHIAAATTVMGGGSFRMEDFATPSGGVRVYTGTDDYLGGSMVNSTVPAPWRVPVRSFSNSDATASSVPDPSCSPGSQSGRARRWARWPCQQGLRALDGVRGFAGPPAEGATARADPRAGGATLRSLLRHVRTLRAPRALV